MGCEAGHWARRRSWAKERGAGGGGTEEGEYQGGPAVHTVDRVANDTTPAVASFQRLSTSLYDAGTSS